MRYVQSLEMPIVKEKDKIVDKLIFKDVNVDLIKPHYKCQNCGYEI